MGQHANPTRGTSRDDYSLFLFCMEGEGAAKDGMAITENPYPAESDQCLAWRIGWTKARAALRDG